MKDLVKSVLKVFDGKQKRKLVGMMFLILINSGVSLLGVSVLSPFITAVMNPEELLKNDIIRSVYDGFHMQNTNQLITLLSVLIIIVYIAKHAVLLLLLWKTRDAGPHDEILYQQRLHIFLKPQQCRADA